MGFAYGFFGAFGFRKGAGNQNDLEWVTVPFRDAR